MSSSRKTYQPAFAGKLPTNLTIPAFTDSYRLSPYLLGIKRLQNNSVLLRVRDFPVQTSYEELLATGLHTMGSEVNETLRSSYEVWGVSGREDAAAGPSS